MNANAQTFLDNFTTAATPLTRVAWTDLYHTPPSFFRFVRCVLYQLTPCRVCDCFSETVILEHPSYIETFKCYDCKKIYQFSALLMGKILAFISNSLVNMRDYFSGLLSLRAALSGCAQFLLSF